MSSPKKKERTYRAPVEHVAKVPLTAEEYVELHSVAEFERDTHAGVMRKALREYADKTR
jgi:hypothetical protein